MTRRTLVRTGIRAGIGVITLAVGAGVVAGAAQLPIPSLT
ncbi:MAG: hypothetical protein JWP75_2006, partial [Frondihabitans sp.]|nr:hypothetical protein [Frondihabitans sp.]